MDETRKIYYVEAMDNLREVKKACKEQVGVVKLIDQVMVYLHDLDRIIRQED